MTDSLRPRSEMAKEIDDLREAYRALIILWCETPWSVKKKNLTVKQIERAHKVMEKHGCRCGNKGKVRFAD